jgi:hypothetical protein
MSRRKNGVKKDKLARLEEINKIDKRLKRVKNNPDEVAKLMSRRKTLRQQLKTKK